MRVWLTVSVCSRACDARCPSMPSSNPDALRDLPRCPPPSTLPTALGSCHTTHKFHTAAVPAPIGGPLARETTRTRPRRLEDPGEASAPCAVGSEVTETYSNVPEPSRKNGPPASPSGGQRFGRRGEPCASEVRPGSSSGLTPEEALEEPIYLVLSVGEPD